uniref:Scaffolding protein n=4 Tax=viral metagenome TaxID=1070528 RepID=A0A6M3J3R1_9ZZZZ
MAVTKEAEGTMVEDKGIKTPEPKAKTPEVEKEVSPKKEEEEPKLYSQKQLDTMVHMATSDAGRVKKELEKERDEAKTEAAKLKSELEDNAEDIKQLEAKLDDITSDDPKRFDVVKELREARELKRTLKQATDDLAAEVKTHEETVRLAKDTMLEISIWEIATEYTGGDPVKLKDLCSTFNATSEEQVRKVADTMWVKGEPAKAEPQTEEEKAQALIIDSGKKAGGGGELSDEDRSRKRYPKRFPTN